MSTIYGRPAVSSIARASTDGVGDLVTRMARDGSISVVPEVEMLAREGRLYAANVGSLTTPATFNLPVDLDQPELVIDVPEGYICIPYYIGIQLEDSAGTDNEIIAKTSQNLVGAGTSTAVTPVNLRTDKSGAGNLNLYSLYSADGTDPAGGVEFWRAGYAFADATTDPAKVFEWRRDVGGPVIVGDGALVIHIGGTTTAPAGYIQVVYAEFEENWIV